MSEGRLVIGTRRYSSWSMRGWLAVRLAGLDVEEVVIPLDPSGVTAAVKQVSPNGLVPYLEHRGNRAWEKPWHPRVLRGAAPGDMARRQGRAGPRPVDLGRDARGFRRTPPRHADEPRAAVPGSRPDAGRPGRHRAPRSGVGRCPRAVRRRGTIPVRPVVRRCGCDVRAGRYALADLRARDRRSDPRVLRRRQGASAGCAWYEAAASEPAAWRLEKYEAVA